MSSLNFLVDKLKSIDPVRIQREFPSKDQYDEYISCREEASTIIDNISPEGMSATIENRMSNVISRMDNLLSGLASSTELGGRLLTNKIVLWTESNHLEKATFLAGQCAEKNIKEPYRTQILLQPANACMSRYRSIFNIREWVVDNIHAEPPELIEIKFQSMLNALLDQFSYFSEEAHKQNPNHIFACYMLMLSYLFRAHRALSINDDRGFKEYSDIASDIAFNMKEPNSGSSRVEIQYHIRNFGEFQHFERLSSRHEDVFERLRLFYTKANTLSEIDAGSGEQLHFWFSAYVGGGARAASVAGLVAIMAGLFGVDIDTAMKAINETWAIALEAIPDIGPSATEGLNQMTAHSGGLTSPQMQQFAELQSMRHSGGLV